MARPLIFALLRMPSQIPGKFSPANPRRRFLPDNTQVMSGVQRCEHVWPTASSAWYCLAGEEANEAMDESGQSTIGQASGTNCVINLVLVVVFSFFSVAALAQSPDGHWYGEGYQPALRQHSQWIAHYRVGGGFRVEFRTYAGCRLQRIQVEEGKWTLLNDQILIITSSVDGKDVDASNMHYRDLYRIDRLTEAEFQTTHARTGQQFLTRRVDPDFTFPGCGTSQERPSDPTLGWPDLLRSSARSRLPKRYRKQSRCHPNPQSRSAQNGGRLGGTACT